MLETNLEKRCVAHVRKLGGKAYKWVCPGSVGVPDRICIFPGGKILFLELKRPGRKNGLSPQPVKVQRLLTALGCNVLTTNNFEEFKDFLAERFGINEV